MPTRADLLGDPYAEVDVVARIKYRNAAGTESELWVSQGGWRLSADDTPSRRFCIPVLESSIRLEQSVDPLSPGASLGWTGEFVLANDLVGYEGYFTGWDSCSVDFRQVTAWTVGSLGNGDRVELGDVLSEPLFDGVGVGIPEVSEEDCVIRVMDNLLRLDGPLSPETYSPPCLVFPGTPAGCIDLGDVLDRTASFAGDFWVWIEDPTTVNYIYTKGVCYLAVGLVGGGTIVGGIEVAVGGQTPLASTSAGSLIRARTWHHVGISVDTAAGTRVITCDGVTVLTSTLVAGTPTGNSSSLLVGYQLKGRMSRFRIWSGARTQATIQAEMRTPVVGTEPGLDAWFPLFEGVGSSVTDRKSGSTLTGTLGTGVTWEANAGWHHASLGGSYRPYVLGRANDVRVRLIDPGLQIFDACADGFDLLSTLRSNHNDVSTASYSTNAAAGTLRVTSGALTGTYSADVLGDSLFGAAGLFNGTSSLAAPASAITSSAGSRSITAHVRSDLTTNVVRVIAGHQNAAAAGAFLIRQGSAANRISCVFINDAGNIFDANYDGLIKGRRHFVAGVLDASAMTLSVWVDAVRVASIPVTGGTTATLTQFAVGRRPDAANSFWNGCIQNVGRWSKALSQAEIETLYLLPITGAEAGLADAWPLSDATGTSAANLKAGRPALTLTSVTWTAGRTPPADLGRVLFRRMGYADSDLNAASWLSFLRAQPGDSGWYVGNGEKARDILRIIIGGVGGQVFRGSDRKIWVRRFEGTTGVASRTFDGEVAAQDKPFQAASPDPAVWRSKLTYARNNTPIAQESVADSLRGTNPSRFIYGAQESLTAVRDDYSVVRNFDGSAGRFPRAVPLERETPLLETADAEAEAARLLALHRDSSRPIDVNMFLSVGDVNLLDEVALEIEEGDIDQVTWVVTRILLEDDEATLTLWRKAA